MTKNNLSGISIMAEACNIFLVDDDEINNFLNTEIISMSHPDIPIECFGNPVDALKYFMNEFPNLSKKKNILFLDINMPVFDGWQFLEKIDHEQPNIFNDLSVYVLSSSLDQKDVNKAAQNPHIIKFLSKPLNEEVLESILNSEK